MRITVPPLRNRKGFIHLNLPIINVFSFVVFYFSVLWCSEQRVLFVVTSCQGWLGLSISSDRQEAVWFFCNTVIRPPLYLLCKCDAKHLKVPSPMIKDSSLSVAILCLWFKPPQSNVCNPKRRCNCLLKEDLPFSYFRSHPLQNGMLNFIAHFI